MIRVPAHEPCARGLERSRPWESLGGRRRRGRRARRAIVFAREERRALRARVRQDCWHCVATLARGRLRGGGRLSAPARELWMRRSMEAALSPSWPSTSASCDTPEARRAPHGPSLRRRARAPGTSRGCCSIRRATTLWSLHGEIDLARSATRIAAVNAAAEGRERLLRRRSSGSASPRRRALRRRAPTSRSARTSLGRAPGLLAPEVDDLEVAACPTARSGSRFRSRSVIATFFARRRGPRRPGQRVDCVSTGRRGSRSLGSITHSRGLVADAGKGSLGSPGRAARGPVLLATACAQRGRCCRALVGAARTTDQPRIVATGTRAMASGVSALEQPGVTLFDAPHPCTAPRAARHQQR